MRLRDEQYCTQCMYLRRDFHVALAISVDVAPFRLRIHFMRNSAVLVRTIGLLLAEGRSLLPDNLSLIKLTSEMIFGTVLLPAVIFQVKRVQHIPLRSLFLSNSPAGSHPESHMMSE